MSQKKSGIDSKKFERIGPKGNIFVACFGGAVTTDEYDRFKEFYSNTMEKVFNKYGYAPSKKAYASYEIRHLFDKGTKIINELATAFLSSDLVIKIDIFFTYFSISHPFMYLFNEDPFTKKISTQDFLKDILPQYYPLVSAWKKDEMEKSSANLLCDAFQGETSHAWEEMRDKDNFQVVYAGDSCEPLISTYIILKAIDLCMEKNGLRFKEEYINEALDALGCSRPRDITFIGEIPAIIPVTQKSINLAGRLLHPIMFLMPEGGLPKLVIEGKEVRESDVIRSSPLFAAACDLAWQETGAVKIFDYSEDLKSVSNYILIPTGAKSRLYADRLKTLGYKIREIREIK